MSIILRRAKQIFKTEGFNALIKQGVFFIFKHIWQRQNYYLIEHQLCELEEDKYSNRGEDVTCIITESNQAADNAVSGRDDFRTIFADAARRLDAGAVAFVAYEGKHLVHIGWIAQSDHAKHSLFQPPYSVAFSSGEGCTGGGWTDPKHRGKGLCTYVYFRRLKYLKEAGRTLARAAVATDNVSSLKMHAKFGGKIRARGRFLEIMGKRSWTEYPLNIGIEEVF